MKKRQKKSQLASALQITISIALISMSVMLVIAANTRTGPIAANSGNTSLTESLSIAENRLTVLFPSNWSTAKEGNVNKLFRVSREKLQNLSHADFNKTPQVLIFTEKRKSHAEAVQRLSEIAQEFHAQANYLSIGGWPALQRRYTAPREQPGGEEDERVEGSPMVLHLTTAIAAGDFRRLGSKRGWRKVLRLTSSRKLMQLVGVHSFLKRRNRIERIRKSRNCAKALSRPRTKWSRLYQA